MTALEFYRQYEKGAEAQNARSAAFREEHERELKRAGRDVAAMGLFLAALLFVIAI